MFQKCKRNRKKSDTLTAVTVRRTVIALRNTERIKMTLVGSIDPNTVRFNTKRYDPIEIETPTQCPANPC